MNNPEVFAIRKRQCLTRLLSLPLILFISHDN
jgi:hypothetical protein